MSSPPAADGAAQVELSSRLPPDAAAEAPDDASGAPAGDAAPRRPSGPTSLQLPHKAGSDLALGEVDDKNADSVSRLAKRRPSNARASRAAAKAANLKLKGGAGGAQAAEDAASWRAPGSAFCRAWRVTVGAVAVFQFVSLTYLNGFYLAGRRETVGDVSPALLFFSYLFDALYVADTVLSARFLYAERRETVGAAPRLVTDRDELWRAYKRSAAARWDLAAVLPLDVLALPFAPSASLWLGLRLTRALKVARTGLADAMNRRISKQFARLVWLVGGVAVLLHVSACVWGFAALHSAGGDTWAGADVVDTSRASVRYLRALYWAATTVTTLGYGDIVALSSGEAAIAIVVASAAVFLSMLIIANMTSLVQNLSAASSDHKQHLNMVRAYMAQEGVSPGLQAAVQEYYEWLWRITKGMHEETAVKSLPDQVRDVLLGFRAFEALRVATHGSLPDVAVAHLVRRLRPVSVLAGQAVADEGSAVDAAFVVCRGELECGADRHGPDAVAGLEGALQESGAARWPRELRAARQTALLRLDASDLAAVMALHGDAADALVEAMSSPEKAAEAEARAATSRQAGALGGEAPRCPAAAAGAMARAHASQMSMASVDGDGREDAGGSNSAGFRRAWFAAGTAITLYYLVALPYRLGFASDKPLDSAGMLAWVLCDYLADAFMLADIAVRLRRFGGVDYDQLVLASLPRHPKASWLRTDAVAMLPVDLIGLGYNTGVWSALRLVRLVKVARLPAYKRAIDALMEARGVRFSMETVRIAWMAAVTFLFAHFASCLWHVVGETGPGDSWIGRDPLAGSEPAARSWYWTMTTLSTVGYGDIVPLTVWETLVVLAVVLLGTSVYPSIIANISTLASSDDPHAAELNSRTERFRSFSQSFGLSAPTRAKISAWLTHERTEHLGLTDAEVYAGLPLYLRTELAADRGLGLLKGSAFSSCSETFLREVSLHLERVVVTPETYLFEAGDKADGVYVVRTGKVEVMDHSNRHVLKTLNEEQVFGEYEVLHGEPWGASTRSSPAITEVFRLPRDALERACEQYPEERAKACKAADDKRKQECSAQIEENLKKGGKIARLLLMQGAAETQGATRFVVRRDSTRWFGWRLASLLALTYIIVSVPFNVSFLSDGERTWSSPSVIGLLLLDTLVDAFFMCDFYLLLFHVVPVGVAADDAQATTRGAIARSYARGWMAADLVATLPLDWAAFAVADPGDAVKLRFLLRVAKAVRWSRIFNYVRSVETFLQEGTIKLSKTAMKLARLGFFVLAAAHTFGCLWNLIAGDEAFPEHDTPMQYLRSVYWALTTMTTVGYGDIKPLTLRETVYTIFVMVLGAGIFGVAVAQMATIAASLDFTASAFQKRLESVKLFLSTRQAPPDLRAAVLAYYQTMWTRNRGVSDAEVAQALPAYLRQAVHWEVARDVLSRRVPLLAGVPTSFTRALAERLVPFTYPAGTVLFEPGQVASDTLLVLAGSVSVYEEDPESDAPAPVKHVKKGSSYGGVATFLRRAHDSLVVVGDLAPHTTMLVLPRAALVEALLESPAVYATLRANAGLEDGAEVPGMAAVVAAARAEAQRAAEAAAEAEAKAGAKAAKRGSSSSTGAGSCAEAAEAKDGSGAASPAGSDAASASPAGSSGSSGDAAAGRAGVAVGSEEPEAAQHAAAHAADGPVGATRRRLASRHWSSARALTISTGGGSDAASGRARNQSVVDTSRGGAASPRSPVSMPGSPRSFGHASASPLNTAPPSSPSPRGGSHRGSRVGGRSTRMMRQGSRASARSLRHGRSTSRRNPSVSERRHSRNEHSRSGDHADAHEDGEAAGHDDGAWRRTILFSSVLLLCGIYNFLAVPLRLCFLFEADPGLHASVAVDYVLDVAALAVTVTALLESARAAPSPSERQAVLKRGLFSPAVLCLLPYDLLAFGLGAGAGLSVGQWWYILRVPRLLMLSGVSTQVARVFKCTRWGQGEELAPTTVRLLRLASLYGFTLHSTSCLWFALAVVEGDRSADSGNWLYNEGNAPIGTVPDGTLGQQYLASLYYVVATLSTCGFGDVTSHTPLETVFTICLFLVGATLLALGIANFSSRIEQADSVAVQQRKRQECISQYVDRAHLPAELQERVSRGLAASYSINGNAHQEQAIMRELPPALRTAMAVHLAEFHFDMSPLLCDTSYGFMAELSLRMRSRVYAAGDSVAVRGQVADELVFVGGAPVRSADCAAAGASHDPQAAELEAQRIMHGMVVAALTGTAQPESVVASRSCEAMVVSLDDLMACVEQYPADREALQDAIHEDFQTGHSTSSVALAEPVN